MRELRGRNAILTGASRGLGVYIARALAREGVNLVLAARSAGALEGVREQVQSLGVRAITIPVDLAEAGQVQSLAARAEQELGPVDILVNNAGVEYTAPYAEYPLEEIEAAVTINLLAPMMLTRAVLPGMLSRGHGHIVNLSSLAGKMGFPYEAPYATTKAALVMFSHTLRAELIDEPVGVSVICPGFVAGDGMYALMKQIAGPAPRLLKPTTPEKVAAAVIRAIKRDVSELIVNPLPMRPLIALRAAVPGIIPQVHKWLGVTRFAKRLATRRAADPRC